MPRLAPALAAVLVLASARPGAADERELQLGLQPAYGFSYLGGLASSGGGGAAQLSYGLTDAVSLQLLGGVTAHPLADAPMLLSWSAGAGVVYAFDIVRVVPFFEATLGVLGATRLQPEGAQTEVHFGVSLGLGADYLITRRFSVGVALRYFAAVDDPGRLPAYLTVGPRAGVRFDLF